MAESNDTKTIKTYNCKNVLITLGSCAVTGYAEDNFISYEALGDGIVPKYGCDGEISRAIDPNDMYNVKIVLQQTSTANDYLQGQYQKDRTDGQGLFPISISDLSGGAIFDASAAWVAKPSAKTYGKDTQSREWTLYAANVTISESESDDFYNYSYSASSGYSYSTSTEEEEE